MRQTGERIGIYGGTFDPVHNGHLTVARRLVELFALDSLQFIPAFVAPHKRGQQISAAWHRYAMLTLATLDEPQLFVSTIELDAPARPYTFETLTRLRALHPAAEYFFIMGLDSWLEITTWREWETVLNSAQQIVVARPGYEWSTAHVMPAVAARVVDLRGARDAAALITDESQSVRAGGQAADSCGASRIYWTDAVQLDISATEIRSAAARNDIGWRTLVSAVVGAYIDKLELYRT